MSPGSSQPLPSLDVSSTVLPSAAQTPANAVSQPLPLHTTEDSHGKTTVVMQTILTQPELPAVRSDALSSTELDQRLETTCFAIEWLIFGLTTSILGLLVASPLAHLVKIEWLKVPTVFVVHQAFILSVFLLLNRFNRWQWPVLAWALSTVSHRFDELPHNE